MHVHRSTRRRTAVALAAAGAASALLVPAAGAQSSTTVPLKKAGATALTLDKKAAKALTSLGIKVKPISGAKVKNGAVRFPITGGTIDPKTLGPAQITHSGGLQLSKGKTKVKLSRFIIRVDGKATLSAVVGSTRATIMNLDASKAKITRPRKGGPAQIGTKVSNVGVRLNKTGAKALNAAFKTTAFKKGLKLGTAVVDARPNQLILESGSTVLGLDAATAGALVGAGIVPAAIAPATAPTATSFSFPISPSTISTELASGTIAHTGGISLTKNATSLALTDFDIALGAPTTLAATVNGGAQKATILDVDLSSAVIKATGKTGLSVTGVTAKINKTTSDALTASFGTPSTEGATLGTVAVSATAR